MPAVMSILLHLAALKRLKALLGVASNKGLKCGGPVVPYPRRWAVWRRQDERGASYP
jgi:hypothetical protein